MAMLSAFNPHDMSERTVRTVATGRDDALREILAAVRSNLRAPTTQHLIISAPRGYGKSFLMRHLQFEVSRVALEEDLPLAVVLMPEELPHVKEPETLVRELTRALAGGAASEAELTWHEDDGAAWDGAVEELQAAIRDRVGPVGLVVALIENFDVLLRRAFAKEIQASRLRALLSDRAGRLMVVAASATGAFDRDYDDRLFHAFSEVPLEPWSIEECMDFFDRQRVEAGKAPLDDAARARGRAVASFIGGTPRLATLLGDALFDEDVLRAADLLQRLVDELTPYYKERIEALPGRSQKLLDALLRGGEPATPSEVARRVQARSQAAIAGPFSDLARERIVVGERAPGSAEVLYRVADRVFAHYYRRRILDHGAPTCPLDALVDLLAQFFTPEEKRGKVAEFARLGRMPEARLMARLARIERGGWVGNRRRLQNLSVYINRWLMPLASTALVGTLHAVASAAFRGDTDDIRDIVDRNIGAMTPSDRTILLLIRADLDDRDDINLGLAAARECLVFSETTGNKLVHIETLLVGARKLNNSKLYKEALSQIIQSKSQSMQIERIDYQIRANKHLTYSLDGLGRHDEAVTTARQGADLAHAAGDAAEEAQCLRLAAFSLGRLGRYDEAVTTARQAADLARAASDAAEQARCLRLAAFSLGRLSRYDEAVTTARQAADLARAASDAGEEAECLHYTAFSLGRLGRYDDAVTTARQAADLARVASDASKETECLYYAAFSLGRLGRYDEAVTTARQAADLARAAGDAAEEARCLRRIAFSLGRLGRHNEAVITARQAAGLARAADDAAGEAQCLRLAAFSLGRLGRHDEAVTTARQGADLARAAGDAAEEAQCLRLAAFSLGRLGHHNQAVTTAWEGAALARAASDAAEEARCLRRIAFHLGRLGRYDEAVTTARQGADLARAASDAAEEARCLRRIAFGLGRLGRHNEAVITARQAADLARAADDGGEAAECLRRIAFSLSELGHHDEAVTTAREAATLARAARNTWTEKHASLLLAWEFGDLGRYGEALSAIADAARIFDEAPDEDDVQILSRYFRRIAWSAADALKAVASPDQFHALLAIAAEAFADGSPRSIHLTSFLEALIEGAVLQIEMAETLDAWATAIDLRFPGRFAADTGRLRGAAQYHASGRSRAALARLDPDFAQTLQTVFPASGETLVKGRKAGARRKRRSHDSV